jgi:hypothetical protein
MPQQAEKREKIPVQGFLAHCAGIFYFAWGKTIAFLIDAGINVHSGENG